MPLRRRLLAVGMLLGTCLLLAGALHMQKALDVAVWESTAVPASAENWGPGGLFCGGPYD